MCDLRSRPDETTAQLAIALYSRHGGLLTLDRFAVGQDYFAISSETEWLIVYRSLHSGGMAYDSSVSFSSCDMAVKTVATVLRCSGPRKVYKHQHQRRQHLTCDVPASV